jgi:hypothetical protein
LAPGVTHDDQNIYIIGKLVSVVLTCVAMLEVDLYRKRLFSIQMDKNHFFLSPSQKKTFYGHRKNIFK